MRIFQILIISVIVFSLSACMSSQENLAPVITPPSIESIPQSGTYRVIQGDTLYSIAWRYSLDYRSLAARNHLSPPYAIYPGQIIYLKGQAAKTVTKPVVVSLPPVKIEKEPTGRVKAWLWPARGRIVGEFTELNKGINIAGRRGDPVYATAAGKVVYSGNGLRGYGNLIIIKHNGSFLTAYAHNRTVFVKTGDFVKSGQLIASMGNTGTQRVMLHFEIRHNGKPENPLVYLTGQK